MTDLTRRRALGLFTAAAVLAPALPAAAAPASRLIDARWRAHGGAGDPDHSAWDRVLAAHLRMGSDGVARFDYGGAPLAAINAYVAQLAAVDPTGLSKDAGFAYWANLYNAVTIALVVEAYPVRSIKSVKGGLFNTGPWTEKVVTVNGQALSLDDIEHGIMRPVWGDARVHYAVNCASIGCPNLAGKAWRSAGLSGGLDTAARAFVNHPRGARVSGGRLTVSSIYEWFQEDFGGTDAGVIAHLRAYAEPQLASALAGVSRVSGDDYDWALNDLSAGRSG